MILRTNTTTSLNRNFINASLVISGLIICLPSTSYASAISYRPVNPIYMPLTTFENETLTLDVNFDGISDISFFNEKYHYGTYDEWIAVDGAITSVQTSESSELVEMLTTGDVDRTHRYAEGESIDKSQQWFYDSTIGDPFPTGINPLYAHTSFWEMLCDDYGSWISCSDQYGWETPAAGINLIRTGPYIGFSFLIDGGEHFGWAHISQEKIYGWGWETEAGVAISAGTGSPVPIPASIWLFGSGLIGLFGIARKRIA